MSKVSPDKKFGLYGKYGKREEMENLFYIKEKDGKNDSNEMIMDQG